MVNATRMQQDRKTLVRLLKKRGIEDEAVLEAMNTVPREEFVGAHQVRFAYEDIPLPIEEGQTISQPYIVALMTQALQPGASDTMLEIGTGSGYAAAVLSRVVSQVYTIERHASLAQRARERLARLGYDNVEVICGDGSLGWPEQAPYNGIVVTAGAPATPPSLLGQLAVGGRLVIPTGKSSNMQTLMRITRISEQDTQTEELSAVRFVPLVGDEGWPA